MSQNRRPSEETNGDFRLLFVCTGNICRSPFAEILTRHLFIGRLGGHRAAAFVVSSAGVRAVVGSPMHPRSRGELAPWGLDRIAAGRFVARQIRPEQLAEAHLVLGAAPSHRSAVVERDPQCLPTAFSMREFARLAEAVDPSALPEEPVQRAHRLTELARRQRGLVPPVDPDDDVVPDPIGGSAGQHHRAATLIREAVSVLVDIVAPVGPAVGPMRRSLDGRAGPVATSHHRRAHRPPPSLHTH